MTDTVHETRTTHIWLDENGILRIVTKPSITAQSLADAVENMEALERARLGRKRPVLIDLRKAMSTDSEGRKYYSRAELDQIISASAFIVGSPLSRVIGSLFLGLSKPPFPVRLFESEEEALEWLKGFLDKDMRT